MTASTAARGRDVDRRLVSVFAAAGVLAGYIVLAVAAERSDATFATRPYVVGDLVAGLAFAFGAATATGPRAERALVALVGLAWLVGSVWAWALTLHQAVLVVALVAFASGRPRGVLGWLVAAMALPIALQVFSQLGVVAVFAAVSVAHIAVSRRARDWVYPTAAAILLAASLLHAWWTQRAGELEPARVYQSAVAAVGFTFPIATRSVAWTGRRITEDALRLSESGDLAGLELVLRRLLGDPDLTIVVDRSGSSEASDAARVVSDSPVLVDPAIAEAVAAAARLTMRHRRLRTEEAERFGELQESRTRLLATVDRERAAAARLLAEQVLAPLTQARERLTSQAEAGIGDAFSALEEAAADLRRIVGGAAPVDVGNGRIVAALETLVARSGLPATVAFDSNASADAGVETALFYACAELLVNVAKHAYATSVRVSLCVDGGSLVLTVQDDGRGGADSGGSGLTGLGDRLDVVGGTLVVRDDAMGGGTTAVARVPRG
jgi:signal transduction histidine kinase